VIESTTEPKKFAGLAKNLDGVNRIGE
jgi:hypothetical protein